MKNLFLSSAVFLVSVVTHAATYGYGSANSLTGLIGFSQSAVSFGANYEHRLDTMGVGGYFLYSGEQKDAGKNQTISFGGLAPMHLLDDSRLDVYLAPGFGITMVKGISGQEDQTIFGPLWKIGAMFKMNSTVKVGLEQTNLVNWFSDKVSADVNYTNFAVNFAF